ncbi:YscO family type III secretion system apparatus protein [Thalassomonas viridans]|uniref:YscO family type III secretion system apparatus protein n=1 Tax=Thalassomonas viridans TaxID=137584 RepID=A0AAE9Z0A2_9GAMM|nr:YscO family type III secretion system apparatus protein [Thalassomonas viridans]WDE02813.1 YscO family type III secretion system apparatus protein [Thalassomonas viridans]
MIFKLQQIKIIREQKASAELAKAKQQKLEAEQKLAECREELEQYMLWQQEEIKRRYQEIIGTKMQMNELSDFNHEISSYKIRQLELEQNIEQAQQALEHRNSALAQADLAYSDAQKQCQKYSELTRVESAKQQQLANLLEDQALDDFKVQPPVAIG